MSISAPNNESGLFGSLKKAWNALLGNEDPGGNGAKLRFTESGPSGHVFYESAKANFKMYWEYGGGDVLVIIHVPTPERWEAETGLPLNERTEVLSFIARKSIDMKNGGRGRFEIEDKFILIKS